MSKLRIALHQPNFCPWLPFFIKMAMSDHLLLLGSVQFEKNNYQNRFMYKDKWVTKPVHKGNIAIWEKEYVGLENNVGDTMKKWSGGSLYRLNKAWIDTVAMTLNIETKVWSDSPNYDSVVYQEPVDYLNDTKTGRLINKLKALKSGARLSGDIVYITNPEAKDKYLDEQMILDHGIEIEYFIIPKQLKVHIFEAFERWGIQGTIKQIEIAKSNLCRV